MGLHFFELDEENALWGHDGGEQGASTIMVFNPSTQVGVLIFTNSNDADLYQMATDAYKVGL